MSKDEKTDGPQKPSEPAKAPTTSATWQEGRRYWPLERSNQDPKLYNTNYKRGIH